MRDAATSLYSRTAVNTSPEARDPAALVVLVLRVAVVGLVIAYAWISDDAFITLRTVDNFVAGRGLTWNPGERVQAYTHPLWLLLLSPFYFITREAFYTTIAVSVAVSIAALRLSERWLTRGGTDAVVLLLVLGLSRAFVDFSTGGLENPLSHLLVALFAHQLVRGAPLRALTLAAALGALCRLDLALLFAPAWIWRAGQGLRAEGRAHARTIARALAAGAAPLIAWELFSLFYYGALVPNTALAKLGHGHPTSEVLLQGALYLLDGLRHDPLTMVAIVASLGVPAITRRRDHLALAAGVLAYLLYLVWIGGDFMRGRLLTPPLVVAAILLSQVVATRLRAALPAAATLLALGMIGERPTLLIRDDDDPERAKIENTGIVDERRFYGAASALFRARVGGERPFHNWRRRAEAMHSKLRPGPTRTVELESNVGILGYFSPPDLTLIDNQGLADPLLARLPALRFVHWRIGHFTRPIPAGYLDTARSGAPRFKDPKVEELWRLVSLVTRGPLWSRERLAAIWRLNTGAAAALVDREAYRYFGAPRLRQAQIGPELPERPTHRFDEQGVFVAMEGPSEGRDLRIALSPGKYEVRFRKGGALLASALARTAEEREPGQPVHLERLLVAIPDAAQGFDELQILPLTRGAPYFLAAISLAPR